MVFKHWLAVCSYLILTRSTPGSITVLTLHSVWTISSVELVNAQWIPTPISKLDNPVTNFSVTSFNSRHCLDLPRVQFVEWISETRFKWENYLKYYLIPWWEAIVICYLFKKPLSSACWPFFSRTRLKNPSYYL